MTYLGFLVRFLAVPIVALLVFLSWSARWGGPAARQGRKAFWLAVAVQVFLAVVYTTPWDNYLVAHGVWYYNPAQVSGILIGYVPIEEYIFFVLQAVLIGLLWQSLYDRFHSAEPLHPSPKSRIWSSAAILVPWIASLWLLVAGWKPVTYMGLILVWALPPIGLQLAFGADILWQQRRLVAAVILIPVLYLSVADAVAIRQSIWTIDTAQTTGIFIGALPLEEGLFFFLTVVLLAFGITLSLAVESRVRLAALR